MWISKNRLKAKLVTARSEAFQDHIDTMEETDQWRRIEKLERKVKKLEKTLKKYMEQGW